MFDCSDVRCSPIAMYVLCFSIYVKYVHVYANELLNYMYSELCLL